MLKCCIAINYGRQQGRARVEAEGQRKEEQKGSKKTEKPCKIWPTLVITVNLAFLIIILLLLLLTEHSFPSDFTNHESTVQTTSYLSKVEKLSQVAVTSPPHPRLLN